MLKSLRFFDPRVLHDLFQFVSTCFNTFSPASCWRRTPPKLAPPQSDPRQPQGASLADARLKRRSRTTTCQCCATSPFIHNDNNNNRRKSWRKRGRGKSTWIWGKVKWDEIRVAPMNGSKISQVHVWLHGCGANVESCFVFVRFGFEQKAHNFCRAFPCCKVQRCHRLVRATLVIPGQTMWVIVSHCAPKQKQWTDTIVSQNEFTFLSCFRIFCAIVSQNLPEAFNHDLNTYFRNPKHSMFKCNSATVCFCFSQAPCYILKVLISPHSSLLLEQILLGSYRQPSFSAPNSNKSLAISREPFSATLDRGRSPGTTKPPVISSWYWSCLY